MKKGLCFLIIIAFILFPLASCMPPEPELRFALINDGTAYEVSGGRAVREVIIPAIYNGLPVSAIAEKGFYHQGLTGIVIPHSVTNIGAEAFSYCGGLWRITVDPNNAVYRSEENCLIRTVDNALIAGGNYGVIP
ncbi:MAG: leucine-rich repeat domain-containing protein, partial [Firmicutes bacterium]|nr:leucine-rich repeat domain-containing protein [Bacillota bacterium]